MCPTQYFSLTHPVYTMIILYRSKLGPKTLQLAKKIGFWHNIPPKKISIFSPFPLLKYVCVHSTDFKNIRMRLPLNFYNGGYCCCQLQWNLSWVGLFRKGECLSSGWSHNLYKPGVLQRRASPLTGLPVERNSSQGVPGTPSLWSGALPPSFPSLEENTPYQLSIT